MKKYVLTKPGHIEAIETAMPEPKNDEVLIRIHYIGICGSDIHLFNGTYNAPHAYPMLFGHEWSGVVEKAGPAVKDLRPGDLVTGDCSKYCGSCGNCATDLNLCQSIDKFGITIDGASAQYIVRSARYVYRAPDGMDLKALALTEPMAVAAHHIARLKHLTGNRFGRRILILGGGAIGMAALMWLKRQEQCMSVDLFDLIDTRTALAKSLGAGIPAAEDMKVGESTDYVSEYASSKYDLVIETTGSPRAFADAFHLVKPAGTIGCLDMMGKVEIEQKLIAMKALTIIGSIGGTGEFEAVMAFLKENGAEAKKMISHTFSIDRFGEAFEMSLNKQEALKVFFAL